MNLNFFLWEKDKPLLGLLNTILFCFVFATSIQTQSLTDKIVVSIMKRDLRNIQETRPRAQ